MSLKTIGRICLKHKGLRSGIIFLSVLIIGCLILRINGVREYFALVTANLTTRILNCLGMSIQARGNIIAVHEFSVEIGPGCIAFYETFVFIAAILAYPLRLKDKIAGVILGIVAVGAANLLRVLSLILSGAYFPYAFEILHDHVAQAFFILFMVVLWILWVGKFGGRVAAR